MRSGDHLGDAKMSKKGTSFRRNFFINCDRQKRISQNERRRADLKKVASIFLNFCQWIGYGLFVPDNNHTTQENIGGVWFFIAATPKHLLRQRPNTKSWSAIKQRTELTKRTSSSKQNFQVSNQNAHFSEPYTPGTAGQ